MVPWLVAAAVQLLSDRQKQRQAKKDLYQQQLNANAQELGGNTREANVIGQLSQIDQAGTNYAPALLSLVGQLDDDEPGSSVKPRSGVRLRREDFY